MNFEQLEIQDYQRYRPFFEEQWYPLCAYSLASILAWTGEHYQPYGAVVDNALIVGAEFKTEPQYRHLLLPVASGRRRFPPEKLRDLLNASGYPAYWFVPEAYLSAYERTRIEACFDIEHHEVYDDYIYLAADLALLKGNKYAKKRNLINQFTRAYVDAGRVSVERITLDTVDECLAFLDRWCEERNCDGPDEFILSCEKQAVINTLQNMTLLQVDGLLLRIDGEVSAFGIVDSLTPEMATLQYEKALSEIKGLYQYFDNQCARHLANGHKYINKESDMGLAGLEQAKRSYHPVRMERSYRLVPKK